MPNNKKSHLNRVVSATATYEITPPSDDDDENKPKKMTSDNRNNSSGQFLTPTFARDLSQGELGGPGKNGSSDTSSRRSSLRDKISTASSYLSLMLEQPKKYLEDRCGFFLALSSGLLLTFYSALYQTIKMDIARESVLLLRGTMQFLFLMGLAYVLEIPLRPRDLPHQSTSRKCFYLSFVLAVSVGGLRLNAIFAALQISPMAIVHTLLNGSPVLVMVLSHCMLNKQDPFTKMKAFASVLLIAGIALNTNPLEAIDEAINSNNIETVLGIGLSLLALLLSALGSILTKRISSHVDKLHISAYIGASIFAFSLLATYTNDIFTGTAPTNLTSMANFSNFSLNETDFGKVNLTCLFDQTNSTSLDNDGDVGLDALLDGCALPEVPYLPSNVDVWCMAVVVAVLGIAQQFCLIAAIKRDTPSRVTMTRSVSIIFSFLMQTWQDPNSLPSWNQWLGAIIILAAIFLVSMDHLARSAWDWVKEKTLGRCRRSCYQEPSQQNQDSPPRMRGKKTGATKQSNIRNEIRGR